MTKHYCEYTLVGCQCNRGFKEPDCTQVKCGEPAVMKVREMWYCLTHGEKSQAFWERVEAARTKRRTEELNY